MTLPDHLIEAVDLRRVFNPTETGVGISFSAWREQDISRATRASPPGVANPISDGEAQV